MSDGTRGTRPDGGFQPWWRFPREGIASWPPAPFGWIRTERLIAAGRVVLAAFSLLALALDPSEPAISARSVESLVAGYLVYALVVFAGAWLAGALLVRLRVSVHVLDLAVACLVMWLTEGSDSPFFAYFIFALAAAALRWPWAGTLWTAAVALAAFLGLGLFAARVLADPDFELNRFILRSGYLAVVAVLLGYLGAHEHRLRAEVGALAAWPRSTPAQPEQHLREVLERAAGILGAPRLLLAWEESAEPWLQLALWSPRGLEAGREPPGTFEPLVAEPLAESSFVCNDATAAAPMVLHTSKLRWFSRYRGQPLHPDLGARFAIRSVIALVLGGTGVGGRLFALDKQRPSAEDLVLGEAMAHQVEAEMEQIVLIRRSQESGAEEERLRLARDLHDGVIQSLAGAALRLETARRLLSRNPVKAAELLVEIQDLLASEQQDLRSFIRDPGIRGLDPRTSGRGLEDRLEELRRRVESYWGLTVDLTVDLPEARISPSLAHEIDRVVSEALVNAAKHGQASGVEVTVGLDGSAVRVTVIDDGRGFSFRGDYDFAALTALKIGPVTLKQRVAAAGGSLHITSGEAGARLDVHLPLP